MKKMKAIGLSILFGVGYITLFQFIGIGIGMLNLEGRWTGQFLVEIAGLILGMILIFIAKKQYALTEKGKPFGTYWVPVTGILLFSLFRTALMALITPKGAMHPVGEIVLFLVTILLVGVTEELVFRGIVMNILIEGFGTDTRFGAIFSVFFGGTLFGAVHLFNMFSGVDPLSATIQAIGASGIGWILCALYVRSRNLWVLALMHAIFDISGLIITALFGDESLVESISAASDLIGNITLPVIIGMMIGFGIVLTIFITLTLLMLRDSKMHYRKAVPVQMQPEQTVPQMPDDVQ